MKKIIKQTLKEQVSDTYFDTFSSAVQYARQQSEDKGYVIDENDWWIEVTTGPGRPKEGQTTRMTVGLNKDDKPQKKALHMQVYNMGNEYRNKFELNYYIS